MGTNSFRLIIVRVNENGTFKIIDKEKELIRLASHEGKGLSIITEQEIKDAVKALKKFKALADFYHAPVRAVATSAVREAKNKYEFIAKVKKETGIEVHAIEGHHEARLIFLGVQYAIPLNDKKAICFDIGGGSTEFISADNCKILFAESVRIGAVRLTKRFFPDFVVNEFSLKKCDEYIEEHILGNANIDLNGNFDIAVGSSGTILATANLIYYRKNKKLKNKLNGTQFSKEDLVEISDYVLSQNTLDERLKIKGLEKKRADIIPAGMLILKKIFDLFKLESITVSENALRSGVIIESMNKQKMKRWKM